MKTLPCLPSLKGNFAIFYMLAKYVPGDIKYICTKFYRHISTNKEANRKFVILISNFPTVIRFKLQSSERFKWSEFNISDPDFKFQSHNALSC